MPNKKQHHFVPQFYLRRFSTTGRSINLCHIATGRVVIGASIRGQCARARFYDSEAAEESFAVMESAAGATIGNVLRTQSLPPPESAERQILLAHVLFQRFRTEEAADNAAAAAEGLMRSVMKHDPGADPAEIERIQLRFKNPVAFPLSAIGEASIFAADLRMKLLLNRTARAFITSDNPVAWHNQWSEPLPGDSGLGIACRGIQIFLPISPRATLLLYDDKVYRVGRRSQDEVVLDSENDVVGINRLQWLSANESIYFERQDDGPCIKGEAAWARSVRPAERVVVRELFSTGPGGRSLVQASRPKVNFRLRCRTIQIAKRARGIPLPARLMATRWPPEFHRLVSEFRGQVEAGRYRAMEFPQFLQDRQSGTGPGHAA